MKFLINFFIPISVVVALAACAPAAQEPEPAAEEAPSTEADAEAIKGVNDHFLAGLNDGDLAACLAVVADDVVMLAPNHPTATGKAAVESWFRTIFDQFTIEETWSSEELVVAADWAFNRGTYSGTFTPKAGGEPVQEEGKYIWILHRQADGSWKYAHSIWNSDNPPPGS